MHLRAQGTGNADIHQPRILPSFPFAGAGIAGGRNSYIAAIKSTGAFRHFFCHRAAHGRELTQGIFIHRKNLFLCFVPVGDGASFEIGRTSGIVSQKFSNEAAGAGFCRADSEVVLQKEMMQIVKHISFQMIS